MRNSSIALFSMPNCEIPMRLMFPSGGGWGYLFKNKNRTQDMILFILFIVLATSIFVNLPLYSITQSNFKKNAKTTIYEVFEDLKKLLSSP